ncbi:hypothetical protein Taro_015604, partial [Colocasia esculenta]|nr:hypothetical protein [Colocasia esculenta]
SVPSAPISPLPLRPYACALFAGDTAGDAVGDAVGDTAACALFAPSPPVGDATTVHRSRPTNYFEMAGVDKSWMNVTDRLDSREKAIK